MMTKGIIRYVKARQGEAEAAKLIGEALEAARRVLRAAGVEEIDETLQANWEADGEE